jgi:polysaccharide transporter, PST family
MTTCRHFTVLTVLGASGGAAEHPDDRSATIAEHLGWRTLPRSRSKTVTRHVHDHKWLAALPSFLRHKLSGRHLLQKTIGNTVWLIADKLIRLGMGLVVGVWTARYLGPARFGLLNYAVAFVSLFSVLSQLGMQGVLVRDLVAHPGRNKPLLGSAFLLRLIGSVVAVTLAVLTVEMFHPNDPDAVGIIAIVALMLIPQAWDIIDLSYQARVNARPIVIIRAVSFIVFSGFKVLLILTGSTLSGFAWATTGEIAMAAVLMSLYARSHGTLPRLRDTTVAELKHLARECWPVMVGSLSVVLYWRIDQVMLGQLAGDAAVGVFSAAVRISEVWYFIPVSVTSSVAPGLTAIFARSHAEYLQKLRKIIGLMAALGVAVALGLTLCSKLIVDLLYGKQYAESSAILAIHGWAGVFVAIGVVSSSWFVNTGQLKYSMYQTMTGAVCNIALNAVLIPRYAGLGAAVATVVSQVLATVLLNALSPRTRELFTLQIQSLIPWRAAARSPRDSTSAHI